MRNFFVFVNLMLFLAISFSAICAQNLSGTIADAQTGEPLPGVNVVVGGTFTGTSSDDDGSFSLNADFTDGPVTLIFSHIGYNMERMNIEAPAGNLQVSMQPRRVGGSELVVSASRRTETIMESPVTIEKLDTRQVRDLASPDLYTGLAHLKGIDLNTSSMLFTTVNTRGFNSAKPERIIQLNDYVDTQIPSLSFTAGNLNGISELDIESVEIIHGPASALYGANAFNGVINVLSKDPFEYRGLSAQLRGGERSLFDGSLRYAGTTLNDRLAFKINATHFQADDWEADSDDVHFTSQNPGGSPAGYDAVNVYGDIELDFPGDPQFAAIPADLRDAMGVVYMPGYREVDLIHDNTARNTRLNGSVHYLLNDRLKASYEYRFATGSATYQSTSRYRFEDFRLNTHRAELTGDDFMLRAYTIGDDSGDTYDLNFTGVNMNVPLVQQYVQNYATAFGAALQGGQTQDEAHQFARNQISGIILVPGTDEFENARDEVRSNPDNVIGGGSGFAVSSRINHAEGQYNLALGGVADVIAGASYRQYYLNSDGTLFNDEPGDESIFNYEYGFYGQAGRSFLDDKLNLLAAGRYDDFQNFDSKFSPRLSAVYSLGDSRQHNIRLSWQNAFRSPTQLDQYIDLDLGPLVLYGNIGDGFDGFTIPSVQAFSASVASGSPDPTLLEQISLNPLEVEQVRTFEAGYKGLFGDLYADVSVYFSRYEDFIGAVRFYGNEDGSLPDLSTGQGRATQVWTNATQTVSSSGLSLGLNYYYSSPLRFSATYTYSHLDMEDVDDDIIPAFNTPEHKYSLGLHGQPLNQLNYSFNYRWVQEHDYEMPFAEGVVPTYWVIDAQANYRFPDYNTTVKIGGQNLTNHRHIQTYAAPTIGRMVYLSFIYEM